MKFVLVLTFPKQFAAWMGPTYLNNSIETSLFVLAKRQEPKQDSLIPAPGFASPALLPIFHFTTAVFVGWYGAQYCTRAQGQKILCHQ